jgi:tRNA pseudouridine55 synthase
LHCKTGHLGTLDPFASGVLPLCLGDGTKIAQFLNTADKEYVGVIRLGSETDTGDPTGQVTATAPVPSLHADRLTEAAQQFHGELLQTPPMYSALKHHGTPLYKLARQGIAVERTGRRVCITALGLTDRGDGTLAFSVCCSKGTYVRVLAQDIATALGTVGHLAALRRTRFGHFRIELAYSLDSLEHRTPPLIGLRDSLGDLREIQLDAAGAHRARQGYAPILASLRRAACAETAKLIGPDGELAAVVVADCRGEWRFARVFPQPKNAAS